LYTTTECIYFRKVIRILFYILFYVFFVAQKEIALRIDPTSRQSCRKKVFEKTKTKVNNTIN